MLSSEIAVSPIENNGREVSDDEEPAYFILVLFLLPLSVGFLLDMDVHSLNVILNVLIISSMFFNIILISSIK